MVQCLWEMLIRNKTGKKVSERLCLLNTTLWRPQVWIMGHICPLRRIYPPRRTVYQSPLSTTAYCPPQCTVHQCEFIHQDKLSAKAKCTLWRPQIWSRGFICPPRRTAWGLRHFRRKPGYPYRLTRTRPPWCWRRKASLAGTQPEMCENDDRLNENLRVTQNIVVIASWHLKKKKKVQHIGYPVCTVSSTSLNLEFKHGAQGALKQHHTNTTHLTKQQTRKVTYILYCGLGREVTAHTHATKVRNICYGAFSMSKNTSSNSIINIHPSYHNRPTASQPPKPSHALLGR